MARTADPTYCDGSPCSIGLTSTVSPDKLMMYVQTSAVALSAVMPAGPTRGSPPDYLQAIQSTLSDCGTAQRRV